MRNELVGNVQTSDEYHTGDSSGEGWTLKLGDCVERMREISDNSVGFSVFSPPFASLYTYSASERDMGNARSHSEFYHHFKFLIVELLRVMQPGRLVSVHCMNLPTSKQRDGVIGLVDFRGEIIRMFVDAGFVYHTEVVIWKDPVTAMQRTKALGLLWKQVKKDSCMSRNGLPDYVVSFRKPGDNQSRVCQSPEATSVDDWQAWASPVWTSPKEHAGSKWHEWAKSVWHNINQSKTLNNKREVGLALPKDADDQKHICPLQLDVIERLVGLYSNKGDLVLSPFAGIGSEGYQSIKMGRRFVGIELKKTYFDQAVKNISFAVNGGGQLALNFGDEDG
ncbi:MAG: site-specific DNA-methyltransferase [Magnetococcales bacterium]|nr:site-specific DNA-methyltransferase [Magnetococcales bacterium]